MSFAPRRRHLPLSGTQTSSNAQATAVPPSPFPPLSPAQDKAYFSLFLARPNTSSETASLLSPTIPALDNLIKTKSVLQEHKSNNKTPDLNKASVTGGSEIVKEKEPTSTSTTSTPITPTQ